MKKTTDNTLKPCPFCNGKARLIKGIGTKPFTIQCISCLVTTDESNSQELLLDEWNHRIPTERPAPCQFYCEQQAFKIDIRTLKGLLKECQETLTQLTDQATSKKETQKLIQKIDQELYRGGYINNWTPYSVKTTSN